MNLLELLSCPHCHSEQFDLETDQLKCQNCFKVYPRLSGVPVFLEDPSEVKVFSFDHVSNQMPYEVISWLQNIDGYSLNIGAGATQIKIPRCIELEHSIYRNTAVCGDVHHLPFKDNIFDALVSFNTFEHFHNPFVAAQEVFRVLKPGGKLLIQTAFMQPLHEEPVHYYNATKYGVLNWFSAFEVDSCEVTWNFNPAFTVSWLLHEILEAAAQELGSETREQLAKTTLNDWSRMWTNPDARAGFLWDCMMSLSKSTQQRFAAGFELKATKPA